MSPCEDVSTLRCGDDQWRAAGQSKGLWLAVIAVTWFVGLGWLAGLVYLLAVRPKRRAAVV